MMALLYVLLNLVIDLAYGLVDPRVRLEAMPGSPAPRRTSGAVPAL
jgi:hypothetical protein